MKLFYIIFSTFVFLLIIGIISYNTYENKQLEKLEQSNLEQAKRMIESEEREFKQIVKESQKFPPENTQRDEDGDGLTYAEELRLGTDDNNIDSDADGIRDNEDAHPAGGGRIIKKTVRWKHSGKYYTTQFGIAEDWYLYYKNQKRGYCCSGWEQFATPNDPTIKTIAQDIVDTSISTGDICRYCIAVDFVQSMLYQYDIDYNGMNEYPKYAIETIMDEKGDCEDTSFLMASILEAVGIDTVLFLLPGHMAVGVYCTDCIGAYYEYKGRKYYFLETTSEPGTWRITSFFAGMAILRDLKGVIDV